MEGHRNVGMRGAQELRDGTRGYGKGEGEWKYDRSDENV